MKRCGHCHKIKQLSDFPKRSRQKDGLNYNCRECSLQQGKESKYRLRYGITLQEKEKMLEEQDGKCAICERIILGRSCVDHDHKTGKIRKILCDSCNTGIGFFGDSSSLLLKAASYLMEYKGFC